MPSSLAQHEGLPGLASVVLAGTFVLEIARAAMGPAFPALSEGGSIALRLVLAGLWLIAAVLVPLRPRALGPGAIATAGRLGWASLAAYGLAETLLGVGDGSVHLVAAMIVAAAVERGGTLDERAADKSFPRGA